jgi:NifU-like protein involved in Fe-S cluster formation
VYFNDSGSQGSSTATMDLGIYSAGLLRLAAEAVGAGRLAECDASAEILNPTCGDRIRVDVKGNPERIAEIGYEVHACVLTQASASLLGRHAPGRSADEIQALADQIEGMLRTHGGAPEGDWSGYDAFEPVRTHKSRHECVMLPLRALLAALGGGGSRDRGS